MSPELASSSLCMQNLATSSIDHLENQTMEFSRKEIVALILSHSQE